MAIAELAMLALLLLGAIFLFSKSKSKALGKAKHSPSSLVKNVGSYTKEQVSKHNTRKDCWIIVKDKVYDVTPYVEEHPGGDAILNNAGRDSTEGFYGPQHATRVFDMVDEFYIEVFSNQKKVGRKVQSKVLEEESKKAMFFLANIAAENDSHKDAVMDCLYLASPDLGISASTKSFVVNFLQSKEQPLRLSTLWCLVNLVFPNHKTLSGFLPLDSAGIISQLKTMVNDPCLDCKFIDITWLKSVACTNVPLRVRMVLEQCLQSRE